MSKDILEKGAILQRDRETFAIAPKPLEALYQLICCVRLRTLRTNMRQLPLN